MVAEVRAGASMRAVARAHAVSLSTVQWWARRAGDLALDRVDWSDRPPLAERIHRTDSAVEDLVLTLRRELKDTSDLGEYGARAIHRELVARDHVRMPSTGVRPPAHAARDGRLARDVLPVGADPLGDPGGRDGLDAVALGGGAASGVGGVADSGRRRGIAAARCRSDRLDGIFPGWRTSEDTGPLVERPVSAGASLAPSNPGAKGSIPSRCVREGGDERGDGEF